MGNQLRKHPEKLCETAYVSVGCDVGQRCREDVEILGNWKRQGHRALSLPCGTVELLARSGINIRKPGLEIHAKPVSENGLSFLLSITIESMDIRWFLVFCQGSMPDVAGHQALRSPCPRDSVTF